MAEAAPTNPLLASTPPSNTSPAIQLHPLVILTISDTLARRTIRQQHVAIAGGILGQQNGREITMEVAFDSKIEVGQDGEVKFDAQWFRDRVDMYKEVHKNPQLDLVGWWTIGGVNGPETRHLSIQHQVQSEYGLESAPLVLFHPEAVAASSGAAGKLPLTIYETLWTNDSGSMEVDGGERNQSLRYREARYTVETGEAEMISVDFVARGGGNATMVDTSFAKAHNASNNGGESSKKGGNGTGKEETNGVSPDKSYLTPEEDDLLTSLTAKSNAIKMLQSRLELITAYLQSLPPTYLSDAAIPLSIDPSAQLNHPLLRSISALLARLPLLTPPDTASFTREADQTASDVELISLLSSLTRTVQDAKELGKKWQVSEPRKNRGGGGAGGSENARFAMGGDMMDEDGGGGGGGGMGAVGRGFHDVFGLA